MAETESDPQDDNKRKFREALERKKAKSAGGSAHTDGGAKQPRVARTGGEPPGVPS